MTPSLPTTWQQLPEHLLMPVLDQHLTLEQASQVWDLELMTPEGQLIAAPASLWPALQMLHLLEVEVTGPRQ